jgi:hypothetical protein
MKSMEARLIQPALLVGMLIVSMGARVQGPNFIVETADPQQAARISQAAEQFRHDLAILWLGQTLPNWAQPCPMTVKVAPYLGAGGATTFVFDKGEVFGWRMNIQGSEQRVLDSVLPHEITHMIFASYFRQLGPLPRWADEGGATSMEHVSEKQKHRDMLIRFLQTGHGIAFGQLFAMKDYPQDVMPLYAEGYSLAEYLINHGGRRKFVGFLAEGMRDGQWQEAVQHNYGARDLPVLQNEWLDWVAKGFPEPPRDSRVMTASAETPVPPAPAAAANAVAASGERPARPSDNLIYHMNDRAASEAPPPAGGYPTASGVVSAARPAETSPAPADRPIGPPPAPPLPPDNTAAAQASGYR